MIRDGASQLNWLNAGAVCLNFNLRRTSRAVTQYYDEALKPTGVKVTQFTILMAIASQSTGAGRAAGRSSQDGQAAAQGAAGGSITDIARLAMVDRTTLTRSLKILEDDKLIEIRKAQPGNKRRVIITAKGIKKMKEIYPYWFRAQRELVKKLTPVKTRELRHLLGDIKNSAEVLHG
ncbi:MAG TPA: MarR family winged helix-turn-helix transcriptional regulator [Turneriella sp.]|nr:MarR family winged helix-turn-helix transcriptional regulator [Turneriella sp.]HNE19947.1 MarR family winged helix-turn-helix transcriptional regulator [Turneriella sp.]HNJ64892.1 MarR family winged helix-turn-helix transcriptional regulator [Turneriella sp.]HNL11832.1 MarR family winged helix-turn-helix transcriptional regulator [Turneriella sp.]HNL55392.1 MarR family winged helix-turn-helix transcriptional regulator [Turneriella sp.]